MPKLKRKSSLQKLAESRAQGKRRRAALGTPAEEEPLDCQHNEEEESNLSSLKDVMLEDPEDLNGVSLLTATVSSPTDKKTANRNVDLKQLEKRKTEQKKRKAEYKRLKRLDPIERTPEKAKNAESMRLRRQDENVREKEKLAYCTKKSSEISCYGKLLNKYIAKIRQAPVFTCSCCGSLCYEESTTITSKEELQEKGCTEEFITAVLHYKQDIDRLCCTCKTYVLRKDDKKLPRVALANGLDFPKIPDELKVKTCTCSTKS